MRITSMSETDWTYDASVAAIEAIAQRIEAGTLPLEQVFEQFEVAVAELQRCEAFLAAGRERFDLLIETLAEPSNEES